MAKVTLDMETFKALASPTRLNVLRALDERRKTLTELSTELELNKATVHEHMAVLVAAGLADKQDEGRKWIYYALTWQGKRLLHPEENTTFMVLLGLGIASAGGGIFMLGRALDLWWREHSPLPVPEFEGNQTRIDDTSAESFDQAETAENSNPGEPSEGSDPGEPNGSSDPSESSENDGSAEPSAAPQEEAADAALPEADMAEASEAAEIDPDGWIGIMLILTAMVMAALAIVLKRRK